MSYENRAPVRAAITEQLGRQRMSLQELQEALQDVAGPRIVKRELRTLVATGVVCSRETKGRTDEFETWERAIARLRAKQDGKPGSTVRPRRPRAVRIA